MRFKKLNLYQLGKEILRYRKTFELRIEQDCCVYRYEWTWKSL